MQVFLDGSSIGSGCIVAANSVVTEHFPDNVIIGGVPAKILKKGLSWNSLKLIIL